MCKHRRMHSNVVHPPEGLGFGVLGFRFWGSGFRVGGLGFRVQDSGFVGFWVLGRAQWLGRL